MSAVKPEICPLVMLMKTTMVTLVVCTLFIGSADSWTATENSSSSNDGRGQPAGAPETTTTAITYPEDDPIYDPQKIESAGSSRAKRSKEAMKIICYSCFHQASQPYPDCLDPFWEHDIPGVICKGTCVKSKWLEDGKLVRLSRACWSGRCVENSTDTLVRTCCRTSHCNSADASRRTWLRTLMATAALAAAAKLHLSA